MESHCHFTCEAGTPFFFFKAYEILVPQSGIEPGPWAVKAQSPNHKTTGPVGNSQGHFFFFFWHIYWPANVFFFEN